MELASLGRLTASIAHEVRNPLGAINHAGQLLSESDSIGEEDKRLTTIIEEHSRGVNNIVENIMNISRRDQAEPITLELVQWMRNFLKEVETRQGLVLGSIKMSCDDHDMYVKMDQDQDQLRQVLWNLIENRIRYSSGTPLLEIVCATRDDTKEPYLDIIDHSTGIFSSMEEQLFEPFFTTNPKDAGLRLFIARELCEKNRATSSLQENSDEGCCVRISFPRHEKQHSLV